MVQRRDALKLIATMMGGVICTPTVLAMDQMMSRTSLVADGTKFVLSQNQKNTIAEVAEMILPRTSTPGARDAGVPSFVENMLRDCYRLPEHRSFLEGVKYLEQNEFVSKDSADRILILSELEQKSKELFKIYLAQQAEISASTVTILDERDVKGVPFWRLMKELTLLGYFTSEVGVRSSFDYVPIPGKLELIKLLPGQKAFSY
jgi:hypothetical protein